MKVFMAFAALVSIGQVCGSPTGQDRHTRSSHEQTRTPRRNIPRTHVCHERHTASNLEGWVKGERLNASSLLPLRVGLRQSNLDKGHDLLMDISDPDSPNYSKHLSAEEVTDLFAPPKESVHEVQVWLMSAGIDQKELSQSTNKQWIQFDATVEEAEKLLMTDFHFFEHVESGVKNIACSEYHLPHQVARHVDYITPGIKLMAGGQEHKAPAIRRRRSEKRKARQSKTRHRRNVEPDFISHGVTTDANDGNPSSDAEKWFKITGSCSYEATPDCVRAQYRIPNGTKATPGNELGIFQSLNQHYNQWDLDMFWKYTAPYIPAGTHPELRSINGALGPTEIIDEAGEEADLDFQVAIPLVWPQKTVLWQTDDEWYQKDQQRVGTRYPGFFNTLFDAIDGSYCTLSLFNQTGNCKSPKCQDPEYPNPNAAESQGGYQGSLMCGVYKPTNVIAISYSGNEHVLPQNYMLRQCFEVMKLALQGVTVVESSGDYGVGGRRYDSRNGCLGPEKDVFSPRIMSNCPYVLSVGATALVENEKFDAGVVNNGTWKGKGKKGKEKGPKEGKMENELEFTERAPTSFASGGGFSNVFATPAWQRRHVDGYLRRANISDRGYQLGPVPLLAGGGNYSNVVGREKPVKYFHKNGRGYPDVSALGDYFRIITGGYSQRLGGTSVAAPIWASVLNVLNEERLAVGKRPVGLVHQVFYRHPEVFTDITTGSNPGCGSPGFQAKEGWDPVTGLGTPIYPKLLELFLRLP
ncbi:Pro-kumamolisin, activation domain-containing protein [Rhypophila decipiens]|uniref:Pro-kumamolisin, activation domain-containing protein n=1 Tax=Rhypophila decipiens TaxID=261697 RepID=A0AAN7B9E6_9PEZI|nr:Pro-kumamolisin, activation domain-containing protein [Rhypophila decipiens]